MHKAGLLLICALALAACGGGRDRVERYYGGASTGAGGAGAPAATRQGGSVVPYGTGPISQACLASGRKAANRRLCGCIQSVADRQLTGADQRMAAGFFTDPHRAQEIRQSDRSGHESFWKRYRSFADSSEQICKGL
jgi:hypothetical protein